MSYDIYGNPLKQDHCEVHPYRNQPWPCDECYAEEFERTRQYDE